MLNNKLNPSEIHIISPIPIKRNARSVISIFSQFQNPKSNTQHLNNWNPTSFFSISSIGLFSKIRLSHPRPTSLVVSISQLYQHRQCLQPLSLSSISVAPAWLSSSSSHQERHCGCCSVRGQPTRRCCLFSSVCSSTCCCCRPSAWLLIRSDFALF